MLCNTGIQVSRSKQCVADAFEQGLGHVVNICQRRRSIVARRREQRAIGSGRRLVPWFPLWGYFEYGLQGIVFGVREKVQHVRAP